ncbi:hypothetical protein STANM309S_02180 [Streptomyces tanashiensis]
MRVLLTGHQGYLGTVMAPVLAAAGHEVVGLDAGLFADCVLGPQPADPSGHRVDLRDVTAKHVAGVDAVIHLAALSNDPLGSLAPELTYDINHHASVRLARLARDAGVRRFLYASTCSVYGAAGGDELVAEDAPLRPVTPYAESKVRVEDDLHALADDDFTPVYMRNATAFGHSPRLRADIVLNNLVGHALLSGEVLVLSDGTPNVSRGLATDPLVVRFSGVPASSWRAAVARSSGTALGVGTALGAVSLLVGLALGGRVGTAFACLGVVLPGLLLQDAWRFAFFAAGAGRKAFVNDMVWGVVLVPAMVVAARLGSVAAFVLAWGASAAVAAAYGWLQSGIRPRPAGARAWLREHHDLGSRYLVENVTNSGASQLRAYGLGAIVGVGAVGVIRGAELLLGPISERATRTLVPGWSARLAAYRSYRDGLSRDAMRAMGVDTARDEVHPDLAFRPPRSSPELPAGPPGPVCVGVMDFHGGNDDRARAEEIHRRYLDGTTRFVRALVEDGRPVRLLTGDACDAAVVAAILDAVDSPLVTAAEAASLADLMKETAAADAVVATRYHNLVCALKVGTPTLALSYAAKSDALMAQMGLATYCHPAREVDADRLLEQFRGLEKRSAELRRTLAERNLAAARQLDHHFAALTAALFPTSDHAPTPRKAP